jgi:hypothetical protein
METTWKPQPSRNALQPSARDPGKPGFAGHIRRGKPADGRRGVMVRKGSSVRVRQRALQKPRDPRWLAGHDHHLHCIRRVTARPVDRLSKARRPLVVVSHQQLAYVVLQRARRACCDAVRRSSRRPSPRRVPRSAPRARPGSVVAFVFVSYRGEDGDGRGWRCQGRSESAGYSVRNDRRNWLDRGGNYSLTGKRSFQEEVRVGAQVSTSATDPTDPAVPGSTSNRPAADRWPSQEMRCPAKVRGFASTGSETGSTPRPGATVSELPVC